MGTTPGSWQRPDDCRSPRRLPWGGPAPRDLALIAALWAAAACDGGLGSPRGDGAPDPGAGEFLRRDSAGVEIVEVPGGMMNALPEWRVRETPALVIGGAAAEGPHAFSQVAGAARLDDGQIVVADGFDQALRYFGPDGSFVRSVGRRGQGPGEFSRVTVLAPHDAGVLAVDPGQGRVTVFDAAGEIVEMRAWSQDGCELRVFERRGHPCFPRAALADGTIVTSQTLRGNSAAGELPRVTHGLVTVVGLHDGERIRQVDSLPRAAEVRVLRPSGVTMVSSRPFEGHEAHPVGRRLLALGTSDRYEVRFRDGSGRLVRILRVHRPARPVTPRDLEEVRETESRRTVLEIAGAADSVPHFHDLRLDDLDRLWVWEFGASTWVVFDADGSPLARVVMPEGFFLQVYQTGAAFLLGVRTDELRAEQVVLHEIVRDAP